MNTKIDKKHLTGSILKYAIIFIVALLHLLVFSFWTTPLYKTWYGCDASFFTMAGRGITKGWVPYIDFFDLKGPYFFFWEALGQLIYTGRTGAFILQVITEFFSLVILMKLSRLYLTRKKTGFIMVIFLLSHISTLWGGNTLEEFLLPLSLLCIYLIAKDCKKTDRFSISKVTAITLGISFGIMTFSKITVAAPIVGMVLGSIIIFLATKRFKDLFVFLLYALLGLLIGITPVFIYFGMKGAVKEMLYSVFVFAFKRSIDYDEGFDLKWELKISGCYFAIIFVIAQIIPTATQFKNFVKNLSLKVLNKIDKINEKIAGESFEEENETVVKTKAEANNSYKINCPEYLVIIMCMAVISAVTLHLGNPFIYYFTTTYPTVLFTLIVAMIIYRPFTIFKNSRLDIPLVFLMVTVCYFASCSASTISTVIYDRENTFYPTYVSEAEEMGSLIPEEDRDKVYCFNMDMQWFEINQILPCHSYTINLQFFVALDSRIQDEILNYLDKTPPKWLIIGGDLESYLPKIDKAVTKKYIEVYTNTNGSLWLLNSEYDNTMGVTVNLG